MLTHDSRLPDLFWSHILSFKVITSGFGSTLHFKNLLSAFVQVRSENISQDGAKGRENDIQLTSLSFTAVNSQLALLWLKIPFLEENG